MSEEMKMPLVEALVFCDKNPEYEFSEYLGEKYFSAEEWLDKYGGLRIDNAFNTCNGIRTVRKREPEFHLELKKVLIESMESSEEAEEVYEKLKNFFKGK